MQEKVDLGVGSQEFQRFAVEKVKMWGDIAIDWLATSPKLLVVHYEHLLDDPQLELRRIVSFLGLRADEERFSCMAGRRFRGLRTFLSFFLFVLSGLRNFSVRALP